MSAAGLPRHAWFQSKSTARPSRMQRLSLRTSQWTTASPASGRPLASRRRASGSAASSQSVAGDPEREERRRILGDVLPARDPPGPRATGAAPAAGRRPERLEARSARLRRPRPPTAAGQRAPLRSSSTSSGRSASSHAEQRGHERPRRQRPRRRAPRRGATADTDATGRGELDERTRPVAERDRPMLVRRVAATLDARPRLGCRAEQAFGADDGFGLRHAL